MKRAWPIWLLALLGVGLGVWLFFRPSPQEAALHTRELATRGLAEYLASRFGGQRALVISNPFTQRPGFPEGVYAQEKAGIRGLERGFEGKITLAAVVFPELKPEARDDPRAVPVDPASPTPLSYLVAEGAFDKLVQAHPGCGLVVSLIGLPVDLRRVEAWRSSSPVRFALLLPDLRMIGDAAAVREAVRSGKLAAFVLPKPNAPAEQTGLSGDFKKDFDQRFILVTPENVDQEMQAHPQLFGFAAAGL